MSRVLTDSGLITIHGPTLAADETSRAFFDAATNDRLLLKWCAACECWAASAAQICPGCHRPEDLDWRAASGEAALVTWAVVHNAPHPAFVDDLPIVSSIVETREGPWLELRLVALDTELTTGTSVQIRFAHSENGASYPVAVA